MNIPKTTVEELNQFELQHKIIYASCMRATSHKRLEIHLKGEKYRVYYKTHLLVATDNDIEAINKYNEITE